MSQTFIKVFQALEPNFGIGPARSFPEEYEHVANVRTDTFGEAFQLTNHIDEPWWTNAGVEKIVEGGRRSSSVGDVFVLSNDEGGDAAAYLCQPTGWRSIPLPQ